MVIDFCKCVQQNLNTKIHKCDVIPNIDIKKLSCAFVCCDLDTIIATICTARQHRSQRLLVALLIQTSHSEFPPTLNMDIYQSIPRIKRPQNIVRKIRHHHMVVRRIFIQNAPFISIYTINDILQYIG